MEEHNAQGPIGEADELRREVVDLQRRLRAAERAMERAGLASPREHYDDRDALLAREHAARVQLESERQRLEFALEAGRLGTWEWDITAGTVVWSHSLETIHGIPRGSFPGTFEGYQRDIHPDDRERVLTTIRETVAHRRDHQLTYRIVRPDGEVRWLDAHGKLILDSAGEPARLVGVCADATDRVKAEDALRDSERGFRAVFDNALDAILIGDDDQRIVEANGAASELLGHDHDALLCRRVRDFAPAMERPQAEAIWRAFRSSGRQRGEMVLQRADGQQRHVEYSATADFIPGRHLSVLRDITERHKSDSLVRFLAEASTTLATSLEYEQTLAAVARLCVPTLADWAVLDIIGSDRLVRRLAVAHSDAEKAARLQAHWDRVALRVDSPGVPNALRSGQTELVDVTEARLDAATSDPEFRLALHGLKLTAAMSVPLVSRGKIVGALTLLSAESGRAFNASDRAVAEEIARRASVAIENATSYREATDALRLKDEFLATVSHELRTPLTAVLGWATMVRTRQNDPAYVARGLETIERNARAQVQLIEDLLDLSRMITGKLRLDVSPIDPVSVVETALENIRPAVTAKGITLQSEIAPGDERIMGDPDRLLQVLNNLLTNATKFTPRRGTIGVVVRRIASSVEIAVRDNGQGIKPEFLPYVFERFRQADASATRAQGGLGLGLGICRSLVELHGGTISAESAGTDQGATFTIRLPMAPVCSPVAQTALSLDRSERPVPAEATSELQRGLRILVVDDEPDTRDLLAAMLEYSDAQVSVAGSAQEGFEQLCREMPDVLISDIGMPNEDGLSFIRRVRELPIAAGGRVPAIALTAYASAGDRARALRAGFDLFVSKPIENQELLAVIANVVGRVGASAARS